MRALLLGTLLAAVAFASEPKVIPLYPAAAPGSESWDYEETAKDVDGPQGSVPRKLHMAYNVTHPTLTVFPADPAKVNGTGVIVCPGGGFTFLAFDYEGTEVARWFNSLGVTAFVLKYRVARTGDPDEKERSNPRRTEVIPMAEADGQQAMRIIRSRAQEWGIVPNRVGIIGFSAGGRVALSVAMDKDPALRANFLISIYSGASEDVAPPEGAGPLFQAVAADDRLSVGSLRLFTDWNQAKLSSELHIYATGGHGFSNIKRNTPVDTWTDRLRDWLEQMGFVKAVR